LKSSIVTIVIIILVIIITIIIIIIIAVMNLFISNIHLDAGHGVGPVGHVFDAEPLPDHPPVAWAWERQRERVSVHVCVCGRESEWEREKEREKEREREGERERENVWERARERKRGVECDVFRAEPLSHHPPVAWAWERDREIECVHLMSERVKK
jgi:hypothetical protein